MIISDRERWSYVSPSFKLGLTEGEGILLSDTCIDRVLHMETETAELTHCSIPLI